MRRGWYTDAAMDAMQKKYKHWWFIVGLISIILAAPNATFIKAGLESIDGLQFNLYRFLVAGILTTPIIIRHKSIYTRHNLKSALLGGACMAIAVVSYVSAIKISQASYVTVITLLTPLVFIVYATRMTGERINSRSMAGISLAALGAMVLVVLPIAIGQGATVNFYPLATGLTLINVFTFPLAVIYFKRSNEAGIPMAALMGVSAWMVFAVSAVTLVITRANLIVPDTSATVGILYSGVVVALLARALNIVSYEHIGAVVSSALAYMESLIAIVIPVIVLNETLSLEMVIGGILILSGVYVVEHHKSSHHRHHHAFRHH